MDDSHNVDLLGGSRVSDQAWPNSFYVATSASAHAALGCFASEFLNHSILQIPSHGPARLIGPEAGHHVGWV